VHEYHALYTNFLSRLTESEDYQLTISISLITRSHTNTQKKIDFYRDANLNCNCNGDSVSPVHTISSAYICLRCIHTKNVEIHS